MKNLAVGIAGILFGFGLTLSGMLNPSKVQSFLDIFGRRACHPVRKADPHSFREDTGSETEMPDFFL